MWEQLESGRVRHQFEPVILVATLAMIPVLIIEYDTTSAAWHIGLSRRSNRTATKLPITQRTEAIGTPTRSRYAPTRSALGRFRSVWP